MTEKAETQVRTIAAKVRPPFTHLRQKTGRETEDGKPEVIEVGELPRALALVADGVDAVDACEQVISERVASNARVIRARDGDPYPPLDSFLPPGERRKRALAAVDEQAPAEDESAVAAELARVRAEADAAAAAKDAEIAELRAALDAATAPPEPKGGTS